MDPVFGMPGGVGNGQNPNDFVVDGVGEVIRENLEIDTPEAHGADPRQLGMSGNPNKHGFHLLFQADAQSGFDGFIAGNGGGKLGRGLIKNPSSHAG